MSDEDFLEYSNSLNEQKLEDAAALSGDDEATE